MMHRTLLGVLALSLLSFTMPNLSDAKITKPARSAQGAKIEEAQINKPRALRANEIAVLYPDIGDPYRFIFRQIIVGIENQLGEKVANFKITGTQNPDELAKLLQQLQVKAVITLGSMAYKQAEGIPGIQIVAGGVLPSANIDRTDIPIHSLTPDPLQLFNQLEIIKPESRRVFVVFNPQISGWLIQLAREAAKAHNIELVAFEARDLRTSARHYRQIMQMADPDRDAIWLLQDFSVVDNDSVLPLVLETAWYKHLLVFSSALEHVQKGALFTLFPNYAGLGRALAQSAINIQLNKPSGSQIPLRSTFSAINSVTATNLGLSLSSKQQQAFSKVFPEQPQ